MSDTIRIEGVLSYEGSPKDVEKLLNRVAELDGKMSSFRVEPEEFHRVIWPGIPIPFAIRRLLDQPGFLEGFFESINPFRAATIKIDKDIRGGLKCFHLHHGDQIVLLNQAVFQQLMDKATTELFDKGEGHTVHF